MNRPSFAVLASDSTVRGWHGKDLGRVADDQGIEFVRLDFGELFARLQRHSASDALLGTRGQDSVEKDLTRFDAVIVRTMPKGTLEQIIFRMNLLQQLEVRGVRVLNSARALEVAIDKYLSIAQLEASGLPIPPTRVTQSATEAERFFEELGGDVIVKPLFGSEGRGLARVRSLKEAREHFRSVEAEEGVVYLQRFIPHPGYDIRVLTCGTRVLGAMQRHVDEGWATNIALGGAARALDLEPALEDLALRAAATTGTDVAGVDILPDREGGYWLLEVNGVPGWRALSKTCKIDVAAEVVAYALQREGQHDD